MSETIAYLNACTVTELRDAIEDYKCILSKPSLRGIHNEVRTSMDYATVLLRNLEYEALKAEIFKNYEKNHWNHWTLTLEEGCYLSIVTCPHPWKSVEVAMMTDDYFIMDDDDFAIIDFEDCRDAFDTIEWILNNYEKGSACGVWELARLERRV